MKRIKPYVKPIKTCITHIQTYIKPIKSTQFRAHEFRAHETQVYLWAGFLSPAVACGPGRPLTDSPEGMVDASRIGHSQTDRQTGKQKDRQTGRQKDGGEERRGPDRPTDRQIGTGKRMLNCNDSRLPPRTYRNGQTDRQTEAEADKKTETRTQAHGRERGRGDRTHPGFLGYVGRQTGR